MLRRVHVLFLSLPGGVGLESGRLNLLRPGATPVAAGQAGLARDRRHHRGRCHQRHRLRQDGRADEALPDCRRRESVAIFATIDDKARTIKQDGELKLVAKVKGQELDAEGVAFVGKGNDNAFYVVGSHGKKRCTCDDNPSSLNLIRVPINPSTGRLEPDDGTGVAPPAWVAPQNIMPAMQRSQHLGNRANACLGTKPPQPKKDKDCKGFKPAQGANIEGIAVFGDTVFLGFRGPVDGGTAYLLAFDRTSLFKDKLEQRRDDPDQARARQGRARPGGRCRRAARALRPGRRRSRSSGRPPLRSQDAGRHASRHLDGAPAGGQARGAPGAVGGWAGVRGARLVRQGRERRAAGVQGAQEK